MLGFTYKSKRLDLHPRSVPYVAAAWHQGLESVRWTRQSVRLDRHVWLNSEAELDSANPLRLYGVRGILWISGQAVPVTLELSLWSNTLSEVAVYPAGITRPVGSERYERRVTAVLDVVSRSLCSLAGRIDRECSLDEEAQRRDSQQITASALTSRP
jgi:hypothetical protein